MRIAIALLCLTICWILPLTSATCDEVVPSDPTPRWWKGNLHTHTFWSDGNDFPEMIAEWYRTHGYNFLALSDHNILSEGMRWIELQKVVERGGPDVLPKYLDRFGPHWVQTRGEPDSPEYAVRLMPLHEFRALVEQRGEFIMLTGEEISDSVAGQPVHMNATNLRDLLLPLGGETVEAAMRANLRAAEDQAQRTGREIMVHLNHPNFYYAITAEDIAAVVEERFYEVYNGHPGVNHLGDETHPSVEAIWDIANVLRIAKWRSAPLMGIATDDSHSYHDGKGSTPGRGWIMVRSRHLTPESLIRAIKLGDVYASSGVLLSSIDYDQEQRTLSVQVQPSENASYVIEFIGTRAGAWIENDDAAPSLDLNQVGVVLARHEGPSAQYTLGDDELYVRTRITSSESHPDQSFADQRQQAWTQPVGWERHLPQSEKPALEPLPSLDPAAEKAALPSQSPAAP